jgi:hypothetical protein
MSASFRLSAFDSLAASALSANWDAGMRVARASIHPMALQRGHRYRRANCVWCASAQQFGVS